MRKLSDRGLANLVIKKGNHPTRKFGMCTLEAVSAYTGQTHSDNPEGVCPVARSFAIRLQDMIEDDEERTRIMLPFVTLLPETFSSRRVQLQRARIAADFAVRQATARAMYSAKLYHVYHKLLELDEIVDKVTGADAALAAHEAKMAGDVSVFINENRMVVDHAMRAASDASFAADSFVSAFVYISYTGNGADYTSDYVDDAVDATASASADAGGCAARAAYEAAKPFSLNDARKGRFFAYENAAHCLKSMIEYVGD